MRFSLFTTLLTLLFSVFFSFSSMASSFPFDLQGEFQFSGIKNSLDSKRYEPVYAFTQKGRQRLKDLKAQGYSCSIKPRQTYLCSKADVASSLPSHVLKRARDLYSSMHVEFERIQVSPVLTNDAQALSEYRINKKVTYNGTVYPYFDYLIIHGNGFDLHKVKWGKGVNREEFIVWSNQNLQRLDIFTDQEKRYYDTFLIWGNFR